MNNEPVVWIDPKELDMDVSTSVTKNKQFDTDIPLYTHPAKTLTDEEIKDVYFNTFNWNFSESASSPFLDFARAILKKASEK